jgi:kynurenine formamidase
VPSVSLPLPLSRGREQSSFRIMSFPTQDAQSRQCSNTEEFLSDYVQPLDGAACRRASTLRTIGIDYLSIGRGTRARRPRHALGAQILIVEGLNFLPAETGECELACLPLRIRGGDGAPARVALKRLGDPARDY